MNYYDNLREKFSPGPGFKPGYPALHQHRCSPQSRIDVKSADQESSGNLIREEFLLGPVDRVGGLVVIAPARRAGDPG